MLILQIISTIVFYAWLFGTLLLLWLIWRNSVRNQQAQQVLNSIAIKNAEAAHKAAEAAYALAMKEKTP